MDTSIPQSDQAPAPCCGEKRRGLIKALLAAAIGGFVALFPFVPGLLVLTSPLRKKRKIGGEMIRITTLGALAGSDRPRRFQVIASRRDAWNKFPPEPIAGVYLAPQGEGKPPRAFSVTCPHLGCAVDYNSDTDEYQCPCHTSAFATNGETLYGPSPRGLDELVVEIRGEDEVWIDYKRFEVGKSKQIEIPS
ncbi:MAG: Rieske 2Fe-2S domain-containing protein [Planctomycetota bacterium]|nr:Rieske 2Fe-2S domain-containing protein [Planctomycetota bacterium]